jgi:hypothetical protein
LRQAREYARLVTAVVSKSFERQHVFRVLGRLLAVCALLSGCAGEREAATTSPQAAANETTAATETASAAGTATAGETTSLQADEEPPHGHALWSQKTLMRMLAGRRIRVEGRVVRLDGGTLTCSGEGGGQAGLAKLGGAPKRPTPTRHVSRRDASALARRALAVVGPADLPAGL